MSNCKNCNHSIHGNYCSHCGQKAGVGRLSLHEVYHDAVHAFTHADRGILKLIKDLLLRPGEVYRNYFQGKRKSYFSPVMFFLLAIGVYIFLTGRLYAWEAHLTGAQSAQVLYNYQKVRYLIFIPLISIITWGFFRRRFTLAECLAFWFFLCGFIVVVELVSYIPRFIWVQPTGSIAYFTDWIVFLIVVIHLFTVYYNRTFVGALQCILVAILFYLLLVYIYTFIAYYKGYTVDFNLWHLIRNVFS